MMKKISIVFAILLFAGASSFSQTKSGTVYSEHEDIAKTKALWKAWLSGDEATFRSFFADSAYMIRNSDSPPKTANADLGKGLKNFIENYENLKVVDQKPASPDALEYKNGTIWVQDWLIMTGIHKKTGIIIDLPIHNLYNFNEDGKITAMVMYFNDDVFEEIGHAQTTRENGKVYINHPYIAATRKSANAAMAGDLETWKSYFAPNARFSDLTMKFGESQSLEEHLESMGGLLSEGTTVKLEEIGYPDCIYYELNDIHVVYSWWLYTFKKDGKTWKVPYMMSQDFNKEGKITRENIYISSNQLEGLL
jgi:hypothetical protein